MKTQIALSLLTALSASMCCITPLLALMAGTSSLATPFHWLEPFRPYFISSAIITLGFVWFQALNVKKDDNCCEPQWRKSFFQSKVFLSIITIFSFLLITFPSYSKFLFRSSASQLAQEQNKNKKVVLKVSGMTCASCELHIESEVKKLPGVSSIKASYEKGSATVEYDEQKIKADKIIAAVNGIGYRAEQQILNKINLQANTENCCANGTCKEHLVTLPQEENKNLRIMSDVTDIQKAFNQRSDKTKFVAILSSTCGWCLQGAQSVQNTVIEKMKDKNISVIIIWTNMVKTDDQRSAYKAASLFNDSNVIQFFDSGNKFGDIVAQRLNPRGKKAWDIYMFFDKNTQWGKDFPRPFDYAHQLSSAAYPWVDQTKYFCDHELTRRLEDIIITL